MVTGVFTPTHESLSLSYHPFIASPHFSTRSSAAWFLRILVKEVCRRYKDGELELWLLGTIGYIHHIKAGTIHTDMDSECYPLHAMSAGGLTDAPCNVRVYRYELPLHYSKRLLVHERDLEETRNRHHFYTDRSTPYFEHSPEKSIPGRVSKTKNDSLLEKGSASDSAV